MFQVLIYPKMFENSVCFFTSDSLEDCVKLTLLLHRVSNCEHRISVLDTDSKQYRLSLYSDDFLS